MFSFPAFKRKSKESQKRKIGLILSGGGARAAYQVGVLRAIASLLAKGASNPFQIISGTSAGALNAASIATHARGFASGVRTLEYIWKNIRSDQIYTPASGSLLTSASSLMLSVIGSKENNTLRSLLNNEPLRATLESVIRLPKIQQNIDAGFLDVLSITASAYATGESVSFFQGVKGIDDWHGAHRSGIRAEISFDHLLASSAIPILFPATKVGGRYFGDGVIRQLAPTATPIKFGAQRIMVIGVSGNRSQSATAAVEDEIPPTLGQIAGHLLNSAFVDTLENDLESLERNNALLMQLSPRKLEQAGLRQHIVDLLEISPSRDLGRMALEFYEELPKSMRRFIKANGSGAVLSLLLFEQGYCCALHQLGFDDAMAQEAKIRCFLNDEQFTCF